MFFFYEKMCFLFYEKMSVFFLTEKVFFYEKMCFLQFFFQDANQCIAFFLAFDSII